MNTTVTGLNNKIAFTNRTATLTEGAKEHTKTVAEKIARGDEVILTGTTQAGKGALLDLIEPEQKVTHIDLKDEGEVEDLFGAWKPGEVEWTEGPMVKALREAMEQGDWLVIDFNDAPPPDIDKLLPRETGELRLSPDFRMFATMNPTEPQELPDAMKERFKTVDLAAIDIHREKR